MREPVAFRLLLSMTPEETAAAHEEAMKIEFSQTSAIPSLAIGRTYRNLSFSDKWIHGPGISHGDADSLGSFKFHSFFSKAEFPALHGIISKLKKRLDGRDVGSVYISRMEPGARVDKHIDGGIYYNNYHRCQVCLAADDETVFHCETESLVLKPGEAWAFDNTRMHWVDHNGAGIRIALVVDIRGVEDVL